MKVYKEKVIASELDSSNDNKLLVVVAARIVVITTEKYDRMVSKYSIRYKLQRVPFGELSAKRH